MLLMWKRTVCSVTTEGSTLTLLRLSPDDSGTYTCLAVSPAGQESKIYTLFVLGQFEHFICVSLSVFRFLTDLVWFDLSQSHHRSLVRPLSPERCRSRRTVLWLWSVRQQEAPLLRSPGWRMDVLCFSLLVHASCLVTPCWGQFWEYKPDHL